MSSGIGSLRVPEGQDPARNSIPGTGLGWHPAAPNHVGTTLNGLAMTNPIPGAPGVRTVEYKTEDYATSHSSAIVTALNFVKCAKDDMPLPKVINEYGEPTPESAGLVATALKQFDQCGDTPLDGVIASKGEIIFAHNPQRAINRRLVRSEFDKNTVMMQFNHSTYDFNAETTPGITVSQLNRFFNTFNDRRLAMVWDWEVLADRLCFEFNMIGVVDAVGPGQTARTDRVRKNYVCIAQRVAHGVADLWHATRGDDGAGAAPDPDAGVLRGHRRLRHKNHRPAALLFLVVMATNNERGPEQFVHSVRIEPQVYMNYKAFLTKMARYAASNEARQERGIFAWFVGTYRSPSSAVSGTPGGATKDFLNGASHVQRSVPQCEINVGL